MYSLMPEKLNKLTDTPSETVLMTLIAQGDEQAFGELYDRYKGLVYSLALNMTGDKSTAEEILLDVFTQVWKHAVAFEPRRAAVKTWVTSIARHRAIDALRRGRVRQDRQLPSWAEDHAAALYNPADTEARFERHDLLGRVRAAIALLPVEQKEALALAYFKGYSHKRIAATLNRPLGTVKTHIRKAMQQLRDTFGRER
jgi:RNA polymerase sigma-70 factor (ECF subfamily)